MKIAVVNNAWPFIYGGAEYFADCLVDRLREAGHDTVLVKVPFIQTPLEAIPRSILAARMTRIPTVDKIVCLKFPTFYIPHPDKVLWMLHQYRGAYELWNTDFKSLPADPVGERIREIVKRADDELLREVRKIFTNHEVTAERLRMSNGLLAEPLYCPHGDHTRYYCDGYNDTIVAFGRVSWIKRQHLAVEAMALTKTPVKLHVAGFSEDERLTEYILKFIEENKLQDRVRFDPRFISEDEKVDILARSLAGIYIPFDEDTHGYVTVEAFYSKKPCVTCHDSGGVPSAVRTGVTGYVADPDPQSLAEVFDQLYSNRALTKRMGENGYQYALSLPDKWEHVISRLLS
jgi:glycosyltransferase involved in cell wall biosynthesis